jgi:hypothetical protein
MIRLTIEGELGMGRPKRHAGSHGPVRKRGTMKNVVHRINEGKRSDVKVTLEGKAEEIGKVLWYWRRGEGRVAN